MRTAWKPVSVALTLTALVALGGCDDDEKAAPVQAASAVIEGGVSVRIEAPVKAVELGGEILLKVVVTNDTDVEKRVNVPRLDRRCATVRVSGKGDAPYLLERLYADITQRGELSWKVPEAKMLAAGESLTGELSLTAMEVGAQRMTVQYRYSVSAQQVTADAVTVNVEPMGEKEHLGVLLDTSEGPITVRLRPDIAPNTVQSFATLTREGFFDGLSFHRIVTKFMAQGGDPKGDGSGGPGYYLPLETQRKLLHNRGVLSMARTGIPDTAGSQFFLMFARRPDLDPRGPGTGYSTFGEMVEGEATLTALEAVETKIADAMAARIKAQRIPKEQVDSMVRAGRIEKSTPVAKITIETATLIGLE